MFNWPLFFLLVGIAIPGLLISIPRMIRSFQDRVVPTDNSGRRPPPFPVLVAAATLQSLLLVAIATGIGTMLAPRVGFQAPVLSHLAAMEVPISALVPILPPTLFIGSAGALIFVGLYYLVFRPRLDRQTWQTTEHLRLALGFWSRILYGGVVEEILIRWGLMTLVTWLLSSVVGGPSPAAIWSAILISGVLFGLGHLPSSLAAGARLSGAFLAATLGLNLWASIIFGWLFWQHGLLAAILAHCLFHLIWLPFDLKFSSPTSQPQAA